MSVIRLNAFHTQRHSDSLSLIESKQSLKMSIEIGAMETYFLASIVDLP